MVPQASGQAILDADRMDLAGALVDRNDGRLAEHDARPRACERVRGAQVHRHVARPPETVEVPEEPHLPGDAESSGRVSVFLPKDPARRHRPGQCS